MEQNSDSKSIYHYCSLSTALEYILPTKQLILNKLGQTNDPRENKAFVFASSNIKSNGYLDVTEFNERFSKDLRSGCKVLCLSSDYFNYFGYEYSRLWALYGGNHKGVCLELDREQFILENQEKISTGMFKKVLYRKLEFNKIHPHIGIDHDEVSTQGYANYLAQFRVENIDHLFFTKNKEWESEREYRVVYFSNKSEMEFCTIRKSLKGVYLGIDFNNVYLPSIKALCSEVKVGKMEFIDVRLTPVDV